MYFVYLLEHPDHEKYYIGCTNDLERRLKEHRSGQTESTALVDNPKDWQVAYTEVFKTREAATNRENNLKQYGSALQKLKKRI